MLAKPLNWWTGVKSLKLKKWVCFLDTFTYNERKPTIVIEVYVFIRLLYHISRIPLILHWNHTVEQLIQSNTPDPKVVKSDQKIFIWLFFTKINSTFLFHIAEVFCRVNKILDDFWQRNSTLLFEASNWYVIMTWSNHGNDDFFFCPLEFLSNHARDKISICKADNLM